MTKDTELSQAMSTRLCHDLSGAIGAIDNYLSLLDHNDKNICVKARSLISEETNNLIRQINFSRSVYGLTDNEASMSLTKITKLIKEFFQGSKISLRMHCEQDISTIDTPIAKAAICLAIISAENIGNSGTVDLYLNKNEDSPVWLFATGNNLLLKEENLEVLQETNKTTKNVRNCREHYVQLLCASRNYQILVNKKNNSIEYKLLKKS
jgi:histidine phosphotransferase ChpT